MTSPIDLALAQPRDADGKPDKNKPYFDIDIDSEGRLVTTNSLGTTIIISLFTDARATPEIQPIPERRRGTWQDTLASVPGHKFGSLLWTLEQARLTQDTVNKARDFTEQSTEWFPEDGVVQRVVVTTERKDSKLNIFIQLFQKNGVSEARFFDALNNLDFEFKGI